MYALEKSVGKINMWKKKCSVLLGSLKYTFNVGSLTSVILLELVIVISIFFQKGNTKYEWKMSSQYPTYKSHSFLYMHAS